MMQVEFSRPEFLHLFLLVPVMVFFYFLFYHYHKRRTIPFANFSAVKRIAKRYGRTNSIPLLILRLVTMSLIILALAGMQVVTTVQTGSTDTVVAVDTSSSMLATDLEPSRLGRVKEEVISLVDTMEAGSRFGVISFSAITRVKEQLSSDRISLRAAVRDISVTDHSSTDLAQAVVTGTNMLLGSNRSRSLLLFTDGKHTTGASLAGALAYASKNQVSVSPVAVGTEEGGMIQGINVTFGVEPETLQHIAQETGGEYYQVGENMSIAGGEGREQPVKRPLRDYLLYGCLALLFIEFSLVKTIFKITP